MRLNYSHVPRPSRGRGIEISKIPAFLTRLERVPWSVSSRGAERHCFFANLTRNVVLPYRKGKGSMIWPGYRRVASWGFLRGIVLPLLAPETARKSIPTNIYSTWTVTIKNVQVDKLSGQGIFCASCDISGWPAIVWSFRSVRFRLARLFNERSRFWLNRRRRARLYKNKIRIIFV